MKKYGLMITVSSLFYMTHIEAMRRTTLMNNREQSEVMKALETYKNQLELLNKYAQAYPNDLFMLAKMDEKRNIDAQFKFEQNIQPHVQQQWPTQQPIQRQFMPQQQPSTEKTLVSSQFIVPSDVAQEFQNARTLNQLKVATKKAVGLFADSANLKQTWFNQAMSVIREQFPHKFDEELKDILEEQAQDLKYYFRDWQKIPIQNSSNDIIKSMVDKAFTNSEMSINL